jgi:hypothetical protein
MKTVTRIALCLLWFLWTLMGVAVLAIDVIDPKWAIFYHRSTRNGAGPSGIVYVSAMAVVMIFVGVVKLRRLFKRGGSL